MFVQKFNITIHILLTIGKKHAMFHMSSLKRGWVLDLKSDENQIKSNDTFFN